MKAREILGGLLTACFGIAAVVLTLCCFGTAFRLSFNAAALTAVCAATGLTLWLFTHLIPNRSGVPVAVAVTVITSFLLAVFAYGALFAQLNYAVNAFLSVYHRVYADFPEHIFFAEEAADNATLLLSSAGIELTALSVLTLCKARRFYPTLLAALTVLLPCFITVDAPPEPLCFVMLVAVLLALFASSFARRRQKSSGMALALSFAFIAATALTLNAIFPYENYIRYEWQDDLLAQAENLSGVHTVFGEGQSPLAGLQKDGKVDLSREGRRVQTHIRTLRVMTENGGRVYLRGKAYANYNDSSWSLLNDEQAAGFPDTDAFVFTGAATEQTEVVSVITERREELCYVPYSATALPEDMSPIYDVSVKNGKGIKSYDFTVPSVYATTEGAVDSDYAAFVQATYLALPEKTRLGLTGYCEGYEPLRALLGSDDVSAIVDAVRDFVSSHGHYALECDRVPEGEDFAVWFLTASDRGYCVHYATAATLMLRAMGVPARYVTGYCADTDAGKWTVVTTDNAHAWAEYYDPAIGWQVLEATPADFAPAQEAPVQQATSAPETRTPAPAQQTTTAPVQTHSTPQKNASAFPWRLVIPFAAAALLSGAIILRKKIIDHIRAKRLSNGSNDERARCAYRYLLRLQKQLKKPVPKDVEDVATKARFSDRHVTDDELLQLLDFTRRQRIRLYQRSPWWKKLFCRFVLCL